MRNTTRLKELAAKRQALTVPGVANALFARVAEDVGFPVIYATGAGIANMHLGAPDIGLTTLTEVATAVAAMADAVSIPLIVDADTGFGNALNMVRTVRVLERAGAAGLQIEDQVFPKRCGHFAGKHVVPADEMIQKIKAAVDSRKDQDLQIIARTDARAIEGLGAAIERAHRFAEAGADMTFVEAPLSLTELEQIAKELRVPQIAYTAVEHPIRAARPSRKWGSQSFYTPMRGCKRLCVPPRRYTQLSRTMAPCKTFPIYSQPSRNDNNRSPRTVGTLRKAGIKFSLASPSRSSSRWADSLSDHADRSRTRDLRDRP
jgi:2-methylisocitrate lyase-like PEP mutase family enzyme